MTSWDGPGLLSVTERCSSNPWLRVFHCHTTRGVTVMIMVLWNDGCQMTTGISVGRIICLRTKPLQRHLLASSHNMRQLTRKTLPLGCRQQSVPENLHKNIANKWRRVYTNTSCSLLIIDWTFFICSAWRIADETILKTTNICCCCFCRCAGGQEDYSQCHSHYVSNEACLMVGGLYNKRTIMFVHFTLLVQFLFLNLTYLLSPTNTNMTR